MSYESIASLLKKLREELATKDLDEQSLSLLESFDADIQALLTAAQAMDNDSGNDAAGDLPDSETLTDTAKRLETHFAAEHPVAETALREIVNALARMGI